MKTFLECINEQVCNFIHTPKTIKKGDKVQVKFEMLEGSPVSVVEAASDSSVYDGQTIFPHLFGGDMMVFAKWNGREWIN
jgi:hypothetical protein